MDSTQIIYFLLSNLAIMLPQLIVLIIGIIFSFSNRLRHPQASKLALAGLGIMLLIGLLGLGFSVIQVQLPVWYGASSYTTIAYINTAVRFVLNVIWAIGVGILIYSIWAGREK